MNRLRPTRILFYNHTGQISGGERMLLLLLENLERESFEAIVACPADGPLAAACEGLGIDVRRVRGFHARFTARPDQSVKYAASMIKAGREFRRLVRDLRPDIIHANSVRAGLIATIATFAMTVPVIWHVHDILPAHPFTSAIRFLVQRAKRTRMIACSAAAARSIGRTDQVTVIRNGIDLSRFRMQPGVRQKLRDELGIPEEQFVVGTVGQIAERKGQGGLLDGFSDALTRIPNAILLVVGTPLFAHDIVYANDLKKRVRELGLAERVRFLGQREDISALMQAFDVLALNSQMEPLGLVLAESLACGTPVIATDGGGVPEIIVNGESGLLVPSGDRHALANAIVELGRDAHLRTILATNGRRFVESRLGANRYVEGVELFYRNMIPGSRSQVMPADSYVGAI